MRNRIRHNRIRRDRIGPERKRSNRKRPDRKRRCSISMNEKIIENARAFLARNQVPQETIGRICRVINSVSFSRNKGRAPLTLEGKIVQDADRLDAMGAVGIARTFAYGGEHGRTMQESLQHFYDKLLRLKGLMNTETGKQMAEKRHAFLEQYLDEYRQETGVQDHVPGADY